MSSGGLTFGADPEFAIVLSKEGKALSAIKVLKGHGKGDKIKISDDQYLFYDNVLLEFNIAPSYTFKEFTDHVVTCLGFANNLLRKSDANLYRAASLTFTPDQCDDPEAFQLGCDPEFCIYDKDDHGNFKIVTPPEVAPGNTFRSCGGHIHIGHPIATLDKGDPARVVKLMDIFVGAPSLLLDHDPTSAARRKLYGGAGTHRIADYGLEYRTLSNFWFGSPVIAEIIYRLTRLAVQVAVATPAIAETLIADKELQKMINSGDAKESEKLFRQIQDLMSDDLRDRIQVWNMTKQARATLGEEWGLTQTAKKKIA